MLRKVSIETGLIDIKSQLQAYGYDIVDMETNFRPVEAVIYSGKQLDKKQGWLLNKGHNPVMVNAAGMTPEEVGQYLDERL